MFCNRVVLKLEMYKSSSIDASLVVRVWITFLGVKNEESCGGDLLFTSWCINLAISNL